jgi:conjugal transfer pilus assembly protein TraV
VTQMLTADEMTSLNRALAKRTNGRVRVGPQAISVAQGIAVWNAVACFVPKPLVASLPRLRRQTSVHSNAVPVRDGDAFRRVIGAGAGVAALASRAVRRLAVTSKVVLLAARQMASVRRRRRSMMLPWR